MFTVHIETRMKSLYYIFVSISYHIVLEVDYLWETVP